MEVLMKLFPLAALLCFVFYLSLDGIFPSEIWADSSEPLCQTVSSALQPPYIPTTGTFRVLLVFVQFQDDVFDGPPNCVGDPNAWPSSLHTIPTWATGTQLIHSQTASQYTEGSLSHFYHLMSNGSFQVIGDVYPQLYLTPQPKSYYTLAQGRGRGWLNQQIIDWMDPSVNFANYDNDNDGDVDMILFIYRNWDSVPFNGESFQGIADLGFSGNIVRDGKTIRGGFPGSGASQHNVYTLGDIWNIVPHEISHYQFGGNHFDYIGKFGIHDGGNGSTVMSGYERLLLGWISPTVISSNTSITLTDAPTTSNYYRININLPGSDEYFLLENRQAFSVYEQNDFCIFTGIPATGLMISHIRPSAPLKQDRIRWEAADNDFLIDEEGEPSDSYKPGNKVQFTPWTRPNSDRSNGNFTGIAVTNIGQNGNNITADIVLNFSSGTLTEDSWWEVSESIGGNVTLVSGKTLTVTPGTTVSFASGATVTINGTFTSNGTQTQRITFNRSGASGAWGGIRFYSGSSGTINYATINYATKGVYVNTMTNVTLNNCTIQNFSEQGVYSPPKAASPYKIA
jgi:M6 family metalloprotease-like protein